MVTGSRNYSGLVRPKGAQIQCEIMLAILQILMEKPTTMQTFGSIVIRGFLVSGFGKWVHDFKEPPKVAAQWRDQHDDDDQT